MIRRCAALAGLLLTMFQGLPGAAFPRPSGHVNDFAGVLTADDRAYLENFLRSVERDTTAEVVVVTVTSLDGMTIEEYANRLFADWGIGTKARDNGVLLLVAPAERQVRIEVGYGLEGSLPDGLAGRNHQDRDRPRIQARQHAPRDRTGARPHLSRGPRRSGGGGTSPDD